MLTFVVPVRHHLGVSDWTPVKARLAQTVASISGQHSSAWELLIVANRGADLPDPGVQGRIVNVDFEWIRLPKTPRTSAYNTLVRYDKGRRVMAGLVAAQPTGHVMVVDYDDLVSARLATQCEQDPDAPGWQLSSGYLYDEVEQKTFLYPRRFDSLCGTSLIIHASLLSIPQRLEDAETGYVMAWLGSHRHARRALAAKGTPLAPLEFPGAVYRVGHAGTTSGSGDLAAVIDQRYAARPRRKRAALRMIKPLTPALTDEFFGRAAAAPEPREVILPKADQ